LQFGREDLEAAIAENGAESERCCAGKSRQVSCRPQSSIHRLAEVASVAMAA
jgi:hypothetical protein